MVRRRAQGGAVRHSFVPSQQRATVSSVYLQELEIAAVWIPIHVSNTLAIELLRRHIDRSLYPRMYVLRAVGFEIKTASNFALNRQECAISHGRQSSMRWHSSSETGATLCEIHAASSNLRATDFRVKRFCGGIAPFGICFTQVQNVYFKHL